MRNFLIFLILMVANVAYSQIYLTDGYPGNRFQVRILSTLKGSYPKGSCYADMNSAGNIAIKFSSTDKLVVSYQVPEQYVINGQTSSDADVVLDRLCIIMFGDCSVEPPIPLYVYGSPLYNQFNNIALANTDTLMSSSSGNTGLSFCCNIFNSDLSFIFRGMKTKNDWAATNDYFASGFTYVDSPMPCDIDSIYDIVDVKNLAENRISSFNAFVNNVAYDSLKPDIDCPSILSNLSHLKPLFVDRPLPSNEFTLKSIVVTANNDTTILQDNLFAVSLWSENQLNLKRKNGIVIDSVVFNSDSSQVTITAYPVKTYDKTFVTSGGGGFIFAKLTSTANIGINAIDSCQFVPSYGVSETCTFDITDGKNTFAVSIENSDGQVASVIFQISKQ